MSFENKFGFAVEIAAALLAKNGADGPTEIAATIKRAFDAVDQADAMCRGKPHPGFTAL
jgi:hypothetical protein